MRRRTLFVAFLCGIALLASAPPAAAQFSPTYGSTRGMEERFRLDVGGFFQKFDTLVTIDGHYGHGTEINLEDVLGQNAHQTNLRLDGYWRFGPHGNLQVGFRNWHRTSDRTLDRDITIGDTTYHVGASVSTDNKVDVLQLYYGYSFVNNGETEFGLALGLSGYWTRLSFTGSGSYTGPGGTGQSLIETENKNLVAPVPGIGGYFRFTLLPRFFVTAEAKGLPPVTVSGYHADMVDVTGGLDYFFTKNIGLGAAYEYVRINFSNSSTPYVKLSYRYSGPLAYLAIAF
ncbi:MAG TPA: hypothetical protein PK598_04955 [Thermoanaerobaculia bacterium]|nr:hypothetical protein [Thermoanaerobaculia bacterium]